MVRAEPDRQVLDAVDLRGPVLAYGRQDVVVGHVQRGLAHPPSQAETHRLMRGRI